MPIQKVIEDPYEATLEILDDGFAAVFCQGLVRSNLKKIRNNDGPAVSEIRGICRGHIINFLSGHIISDIIFF